MWILTKYGFYSIIEDADDARHLIVRAGRRNSQGGGGRMA